jgi:hypothetical protein
VRRENQELGCLLPGNLRKKRRFREIVVPESGVNLCCALSTARQLLIRSTLKLQQSMTLIQKRAQGIEGFGWGTLQKGRKLLNACRNVDLQSARFAAVQQVCGGYAQLDGTLNPHGYWQKRRF